jgi:HEAT repeat protein
MNTKELLEGIRSTDDQVRMQAWLAAGPVGAAAVKPLAEAMRADDLEVARAAKRALWQITHYVGRPGADSEKRPVLAELIALCGGDQPPAVRREVLWMLSEIGGDESVDTVAELLVNEDLREDARMALQRIPGDKSLAALRAALAAAPADFKPNIAVSLRQRGVEVPGIPDLKLTPVKQTSIKPVASQPA